MKDIKSHKNRNLILFKKKANLKISIIILMLILASQGCGIMGNKRNSYRNKIINYLNNKYDDQFEYYKPFGGGAGAESAQLLAKSKKYPKKEIWAAYTEDNGTEIYYDNYMGIKYEEKTRSVLTEVVQKIYGLDSVVFYESDTKASTKGASDEMPFEEYASSPSSCIGFVAIIHGTDGESENNLKEKIVNGLKEKNICATGSIYIESSIEQIKEIKTIKDLSKYTLQEKYEARFSF